MGRSLRTGFVSYAHDDVALAERFLRVLRPRCATRADVALELCSDDAILAGERWRERIERALAETDFGLLLVSPSFLASAFVTAVELPALLAPPRVVIPVALEPLDLAGADLRGLADHQFFRYRASGSDLWQSFDECGGVNRKRFCDELVRQIAERLR